MKWISILIIAVIGLLIAGCSIPGKDDIVQNSIGGGSYGNGGKDLGLVLEFPENMPVNKIRKGAPLTFVFRFLNYGKVPARNIRVKVEGFEPNFVHGLNTDYSLPEVNPANQNGPGVDDSIIVNSVTVDGFNSDEYDFNAVFRVCYDYKTIVSTDLCLPSLTPVEDPVCKPTTSFTPPNDKTPLQITNIEITPLENNQVRFDFTVKNKGSGITVDNCFPNIKVYKSKVRIDKFSLGGISGDCYDISGNKGVVEIRNGAGNFYCVVTRSSNVEGPYSSQISLELSYKYQDTFKKIIKVTDPTFNR